MSKRQTKLAKKAESAKKSSAKKEKNSIAKLNLGLYRAILLCIEVVLLGWMALVANNIFHAEFELESPVFLVMAIVFFAILFFVTLFSKERDMLLMCTVFLVTSAIGVIFVPCYALLATYRCPDDSTNCQSQVLTYEHRNIYWIKIK